MSKIGIAFAGGGPLGGIYEIGASVALAESIEGIDFKNADIFVGVSSGSLIASAFANGIDPERLARILIHNDAEEFFDPDVLMRPAFGEYLQRALSVPGLLFSATQDYLSAPFRHGLFESFQRLSRAIPTGLFDNRGIDRIMRELFSKNGRTNDFRKLRKRLVIVATDLDSGESIEFGSPGHDDVPISVAVQASTALPGLFPPVRINGHHYVDGALIKTLHASVALKEGAELVLCINPLVPFDAELAAHRNAREREALNDGGLPVVLSQTFRAIIHSRMRVGMDRYRHQYENADVILFEPSRDDAEMFFTNVFSYRDRQRLCEHAYQRTRTDLYRRRHELRPILERHGLALDLAVLKDHRRTLLDSSRTGRRHKLQAATVALDQSLAELERVLAARRPA
ncbi:MAG: patatin family protein [Betaproteobacteria bacterium]|nr:patatin family protein [Betaproteobacteria bacterium]